MPKLYNKNIDKNIPKEAIYVGRPSRWGNPYSHLSGTLAKYKVKTRQEAIDKYKEYLIGNPELLKAAKYGLKGKDLICFCRPKEGFKGRVLCHGQILISISNNCLPEEVE